MPTGQDIFSPGTESIGYCLTHQDEALALLPASQNKGLQLEPVWGYDWISLHIVQTGVFYSCIKSLLSH